MEITDPASLLPLDALDQIMTAYGRRSRPTVPTALPETAGLAVVLLVNRSTAPERAAHRRVHRIDEALCAPAEAFAAAIGTSADPSWRGGGLAGLRRLLGSALHSITFGCSTESLYLEEQPTTEAVTNWLAAHAVAPHLVATAFDALVTSYRSNVGVLAGWSCSWERPADTADMRLVLLGEKKPRWERTLAELIR